MLTFRKQTEETTPYLAVTGSDLPVRDLVIPEQAEGLPVRKIDPHAFAGQDRLHSVTLPQGMKGIGAFAFHNCRALRRIDLSDGVTDYGDGVFRQCTALTDVRVDMRTENYGLLTRLLDDSDQTMTFRLHLPDGGLRLTFPGYLYDFTENTMARTIQFNIEGSGMAFRECVSRSGVDTAAYDRLFYRAKLDDITITSKLVTDRLMAPYGLTDQAREGYEAYLRRHAAGILKALVSEEDEERIRFLTGETENGRMLCPPEALREALALSGEKGFTKITALLLDASGRAGGTPQGRLEL